MKDFTKTIILATLATLVISSFAMAQIEPDQLPSRYKKWLTEEVVYIITQAEKENFLKIEGNELRDRFIEIFWEKRDPTPGTPKNEFLEEHYRRIEYANKHFGPRNQKNGWRNDRGRMYIVFGEPKQRLEYPNDSLVYPCELWFYPSNNRVSTTQFFYLIFFRRNGAGDYMLYHPVLDGPKELTWRGHFDYSDEDILEAIQMLSVDLAHAALSYDPMDMRNSLASEVLIGQIESWPERAVDGSWAKDFVDSKGKVDVQYSFKTLDVNTVTMIHSPMDGRQQLHYAFMIDPSDIEMGQHEDRYYVVFEILPSLSKKDGGEIIFEGKSAVEINFNNQEFEDAKNKSLMIADVIPVIPGDYMFTLRVRNKVSKNYFMFNKNIHIPMPAAKELNLSPVMMTYGYDKDDNDPAYQQPFKIFDVSFFPSSTMKFANMENIHVYTELYFPRPVNGVAQVGEIQFEFKVFDTEEKLVKQLTHIVEKAKVEANRAGIIYMSRQIPVSDLAVGEYRMEVTAVTHKDVGLTAKRSTLFTIAEPKNIIRPRILRTRKPMNADRSSVLMARGDLLTNAGFYNQALYEYNEVLKKDRENIECSLKMGRLLLLMKRPDDAYQVVRRVEFKDPNNREIVFFLAKSAAAKGKYAQAIGFYERLLFLDPEDTQVLNNVGELHKLAGNSDKAKAKLLKSLEIDPDQTAVKKMLAELE